MERVFAAGAILSVGRVGKSSMLKQIIKGTFDEGEQTTTKANNYKKNVSVNGTVILVVSFDETDSHFGLVGYSWARAVPRTRARLLPRCR